MNRKYILPFLFVGLTFSLVVGLTVAQRQGASPPPLASHKWSSLSKLEELKTLLKGFEIKSIIDTSCEEAGLVQKLDLGFDQYIGVERRKEIVDALRISMGSAQRTFLAQDITKDLLPHADMILCWDSLQMLSSAQIHSTLMLLKKSGVKYLLAAHYPELKKNKKGKRGEYRPINWTLAPYRFPDPMVQISEQKETDQTKSLALWKISDLP